ncbi:DUF393 domain-containing protein [Microlunatus elymi]|uniref:DUF393 domain-containing protein n=1 Tax=Microlunatus elymi TaxID=2596828 RepID=A0A516PYH1_9ACTN|nr:DCC1-like thiol-disulfide oxidoreductase family protein [Microlunatus elymi]QDP96213.1 DUF393 domain-containing protein [Microlunatus elymi]
MTPAPTPSIRAGHRDRPWVIIDGDCAFCSSSTSWLADRLHRTDRPDVQRVPYQFLELETFGLSVERTRRELIWLPAGDGVPPQVPGGADAFAAWLSYAGRPYAMLGRLITLPVINSLAWFVYRLVAANRQRLPGGTPACAMPPAQE